MKTLQQILESILNRDFDVTDDDINPMREFIAKYKSDYKSKGSYYIKSKWSIAEMERLLGHYGRKVSNAAGDADFMVEIPKARKNKETIVLVQPNSNFSILVPRGGAAWEHFTCDPAFTNATLFHGFVYTEENLISRYWFFQKSLMFVLKKNNKFLKDIQRFLNDRS